MGRQQAGELRSDTALGVTRLTLDVGRNGVSKLHPPDHTSVLHLSLLILYGLQPPSWLTEWHPGKVMGRRKVRGRSGKPKSGFKWVAGHGRSLQREGMELGQVRSEPVLMEQCGMKGNVDLV